MAAKIPLKDQIAEIELSLVNRRGFVSAIRDAIRLKAKTQHDLDYQISRLPALEAALATLKWLEANQDVVRTVYSQKAK